MTNKKQTKIIEAINDLQEFLECDLYSKFRPEVKLNVKGKKEIFYREDYFKDEDEFVKYLNAHFNILRKEIK